MKIGIRLNKKNCIFFVLTAVCIVFVGRVGQVGWGGMLLALIAGLVISMTECRLTNPVAGIVAGTLELLSGALISAKMVQYLILLPENFEKSNATIVYLNAALLLILFLAVLLITNNTAVSCTVSMGIVYLGAFADYFVYQFRQNEIVFSDLKATGTGLSVAKGYRMQLHERGAVAILIALVFLMLVWKLRIKFQHRGRMRIVTALGSLACIAYLAYGTQGMNTESWQQKGTYRNGFYLNFALSVRDSFVKAPSGYSLEMIRKLESIYGKRPSSEASPAKWSGAEQKGQQSKKPTIIVIMSESYADLSVLGKLETNIDVMPTFRSLQENTVRGYALSSVFGAKTPNSEWEYLTGNTMAFLPNGSVAYQQYIKDDANSLVSQLKDEGYTCVAMHPYYETGWSRNTVYPNLGFDECLFLDAFPQKNMVREYVSDQELFEKIIERFEQKQDGENLFMMNVTMQNHGGYVTDYANWNQEVYKLGRSYTDANEYLSLLKVSDEALSHLITYFKGQSEPVEIVFFGDHQPGLSEGFYEILNGKGLSNLTEQEVEALYTVPFFVWTNYDSQERQVQITSLNMLVGYTLEQAGIEKSPYESFLSDFSTVIPAINSRGYYSLKNKKYMMLSQATGEEAEWIEKYQALQYNAMFDGENRSRVFFPTTKQ